MSTDCESLHLNASNTYSPPNHNHNPHLNPSPSPNPSTNPNPFTSQCLNTPLSIFRCLQKLKQTRELQSPSFPLHPLIHNSVIPPSRLQGPSPPPFITACPSSRPPSQEFYLQGLKMTPGRRTHPCSTRPFLPMQPPYPIGPYPYHIPTTHEIVE